MPSLETPSAHVPGRDKLPGYLGGMPLLYPLWLEVYTGEGPLLTVAGVQVFRQGYRGLCLKMAAAFQIENCLYFLWLASHSMLTERLVSATLGLTESPGGGKSLHRELKLASRVTDPAEDTANFQQSKY